MIEPPASLRPLLYRLALTAHGLHIDVRSSAPAPIEWARAYLLPDAEGPLSGRRELRQWTVEGVREYADALRSLATRTDVLRTFKGVCHERLEILRPGKQGLFHAFVPSHLDYIVTREGGTIDVWMATGAKEPDRHLLRFIREIVYRAMESAGAIALHAAAVAIGERDGYLLVGPSGAGKTTLMIAMLHGAAGRLLCNDRVMLAPELLRLYGLPLPVRVGAGTVMSLEPLRCLVGRADTLIRAQKMGGADLVEASHPSPTNWASPAKVELSPVELCRALGADLQPSATLRAVIVPCVEPGPCPPSFEPISADEVLGIIEGERCTPRDPLWSDPWLEPRVCASEEDIRRGLRETVARVSAYRIYFGTDWASTLAPFLRSKLPEAG